MSFFLLKETMIIFWRHVFENISFILFKSTSMNWYISIINRVICFKLSQIFEKVMQKFRYTILIGQTNDTKILSDQRGSHSWTGFFKPKKLNFRKKLILRNEMSVFNPRGLKPVSCQNDFSHFQKYYVVQWKSNCNAFCYLKKIFFYRMFRLFVWNVISILPFCKYTLAEHFLFFNKE